MFELCVCAVRSCVVVGELSFSLWCFVLCVFSGQCFGGEVRWVWISIGSKSISRGVVDGRQGYIIRVIGFGYRRRVLTGDKGSGMVCW